MSTWALLYWVALLAGAELLARGHLANRPDAFHAGAWLLCAVLAATAWRRRDARAVAALLAGLALLPAALSLQALGHRAPAPAPVEDPLAAFWREHAADRAQLLRPPRERLAEGTLRVFGERVALDPRGFRAGEPLAPGSFRIIALGGSNTFGATQGRGEQPWPALLEQAIATELRCVVPIQVINAGVPGRRFAGLVESVEPALRDVAPDVLVVYPGPEQLALLAREIPELAVAPAAPIPPRVSPLLAAIERRLRERSARRAYERALRAPDRDVAELRRLPLAGAYRRLMVEAREHGTDVVLAPLALALPPEASEAAIRRHEAVEPRTRQLLAAQRLHTRLLASLGATYRAPLADLAAGPAPGDDAAFLDLWLLSQRGREQLARAVLEALRPRLAETPRPGCTPRDARDTPAAAR